MLDVQIRPRAQLDIESTFIYIAVTLGSPKAAIGTTNAIYEAIERVAELPESGMKFEAEQLERAYRRALVKRHWIYYTHDEATLTVWRVFHERQDIDSHSLVEL